MDATIHGRIANRLIVTGIIIRGCIDYFLAGYIIFVSGFGLGTIIVNFIGTIILQYIGRHLGAVRALRGYYLDMPNCATCLGILCQSKVLRLKDVSSSAEKGCSMCKLISAAARCNLPLPENVDELDFEIEDLDIDDVEVSRSRDDGSLVLDYECLWGGHRGKPVVRKLQLGLSPWGGRGFRLRRRTIKKVNPISVPGSDASLRKIQDWLRFCDRHDNCRSEPPEYPTLPTRVLDVLSDSPNVVLRETQGIRDRYTTLSHPWGDELPLHTTKATLARRQQSIPYGDLPPTFQDAVKITRHLGVRWIWIDALCIIQDDVTDWQTEAAKMASVYRDSHLTIAASSARKPSDGCFASMRPGSACISHNEEKLNVDGLYFCLESPRSLFPRCLELRGRADEQGFNFPLMRRSWVLQERLLSRRVLHLSTEEMIWECRSGVMCECELGNIADSEYEGGSSQVHGATMIHAQEIFLRKHVRPAEETLSVWRQLSQKYFNTDITYPKDRLPALSGLARAYHEAHPDLGAYLAGLWQKDVPAGLLWYSRPRDSWEKAFVTGGVSEGYTILREIAGFLNEPVPLNLYRCFKLYGTKLQKLVQSYEEIALFRGITTCEPVAVPSWSWISLCQLLHPKEKDRLKFLTSDIYHSPPWLDVCSVPKVVNIAAELINWDIKLEGHDPYGAISWAKLVLKSPIASVRLGVGQEPKGKQDKPPIFQGIQEQEVTPNSIGMLAAGLNTMFAWPLQFDEESECGARLQRCCVRFILDRVWYDWVSQTGTKSLAEAREQPECLVSVIAKMDIKCADMYSLETHRVVAGLLLRPSKEHPGCYERIGLVCCEEDFLVDVEERTYTLV